jgi:dGTPase
VCDPRKGRTEPLLNLGSGRDDFSRDYTAILYSHAFRRLRHKTQVFFFSQNDHVCTRLDHSLYVAAISEVVTVNLRVKGIECDSMAAKAIGIGHDLGHAPFGHAGEEVLNSLAESLGGFSHEKHGLRIVNKIEKPRDRGSSIGLNLTLAVRDGIINHCGEDKSTTLSPSASPDLERNSLPFTIEGCVVRLVDKIAYLGRDLEDAVIAHLIEESDIPADIRALIGTKNGEIVDYFVGDIITCSEDNVIQLSDRASELMNTLTEFNYERIYGHDSLTAYKKRVRDVLETLFERFMRVLTECGNRIDLYLRDECLDVVKVLGKYVGERGCLYFDEEAATFANDEELFTRIAVDYLSTLTDSFVFEACKQYFLPKPII